MFAFAVGLPKLPWGACFFFDLHQSEAAPFRFVVSLLHFLIFVHVEGLRVAGNETSPYPRTSSSRFSPAFFLADKQGYFNCTTTRFSRFLPLSGVCDRMEMVL